MASTSSMRRAASLPILDNNSNNNNNNNNNNNTAMPAPQGLSMYTEQHVQHAPQWQLASSRQVDQPPTCLACSLEHLEDPELLQVKRKLVLGRLLGALSAQPDAATRLLRLDMRVTGHLVLVLIKSLTVPDEMFVSMASEIVVLLVNLLRSEVIVCCIMDAITQQSLKLCNFKRSVPLFSIVGRLLHDIPALSAQLLTGYGTLVDYVAAGMAYPEPAVQAAAAYIFVYLYGGSGARGLVPAPLTARLIPALLTALTGPGGSTTGQRPGPVSQLHINALGLLRVMVEDPSVTEMFFTSSPSNTSTTAPTGVTLALKRALLGREHLLQVAAVQCLNMIIKHDTGGQHFADLLLQQDVAEFLFEALVTTNELLIGSILNCLLLFTKTKTFFEKCHAVYGIEAIMRAVEQSLRLQACRVIHHGMCLLKVVLTSQPSSIRLFSNVGLARQCFQLTTEGISSSDHNVSLAATDAFAALLSTDHLTCPVPYGEVVTGVKVLVGQGERLTDGKGKTPSARQLTVRGKRKHEAQRSQRAKHRIQANVTALRQACLLAVHCSHNPAADAKTFLHPPVVVQDQGSTPNSGQPVPEQPPPGTEPPVTQLSDLVRCLHTALTDYLIPTIVLVSSGVEDGEVLLSLVSCLNLMWELDRGAMDTLGQLLLESGFINFCLTTRARFRTTRDAVDDCLVNLYLLHIADYEDQTKEQAVNYLKEGLQTINGEGVELLSLLHQNAADPEDTTLSAAQCAAISLLCTAYRYSDREVAPPSDVLAALSTYLRLHEYHVTGMPAFLLRQLVTLYALSWSEHSPDPSGAQSGTSRAEEDEGGLVLGRLLGRVVNTRLWCERQPQILHWVFSHPDLATQLGPAVVCLWVEADDEAAVQVLVDTARHNNLCLQAVLALFTTTTDQSLKGPVTVISKILSHPQPTSDCVSLIRHSLPAVLQCHLLSSTGTNSQGQFVVVELLNLLVELKQDDYREPLTEADTKLAFHVCRLMSQHDVSTQSGLQEAALDFLSCLLIQSDNNSDTRVACLVLSNTAVMTRLEETLMMTSRPRHSAVMVTSLLIRLQHAASLQVKHVIHVSQQKLLPSSAHVQNVALRSALFTLWAAYLDTAKGCSTAGVVQLDKEGEELGLLTTTLRLLVIDVLHAMAQGWPLLQKAACECFRAILSYSDDVDESKKPSLSFRCHVVQQPWVKFFIRLLHTREGRTGTLPPHVFNFCTQVLAAAGPGYSDTLNTMLVRHLVNMDDTSEQLASIPLSGRQPLIQLLSQDLAVTGVTRPDMQTAREQLQHTLHTHTKTLLQPVKMGDSLLYSQITVSTNQAPPAKTAV